MGQLTSAQRYTISVMYKQGFAQKVIAETIKKDKSVVSRELKRNLNDRGEYSFTHAQMLVDILVDTTSNTRLRTNMHQLGRQTVTHVHHGRRLDAGLTQSL